MIRIGLVLTALIFINGVSPENIQCRDEDGNPVDWYYVYKLPKLKDHTLDVLKQGVGYMYITAEKSDEWHLSNKSIEDPENIIGKTISPMYSDKKSLKVIYNDQFKWHFSWSKGHTKGVLSGNKEGGFWLVHSIPRFPSVKSYSYPSSGKRNGQTALCMSLTSEELNKIGVILRYNNPKFIDHRIPKELETIYPELLKRGQKIHNTPWNYLTNVTTRGGTTFKTFAKTSKFHKDLYEWVAESLESDLAVQTWPLAFRRLPSSCETKHKVLNIKSVKLPDNSTFPNTHDHSKWAVASTSQEPWTCVGDINRAKRQQKRGGGTVCLKNAKVWEAFHQLINEIEYCPSPTQGL